jgi:crotonobetainyl-CoA:carnitine CoA-transferase CaiB-like acyl-CoA transferase
VRDPQIVHRGALSEVKDGGGTFKVLNLPVRVSGTNVSAGKQAATLGEHTVTYLRETGLSKQEIAAFTGNSLAAEWLWRTGSATAAQLVACHHPLIATA